MCALATMTLAINAQEANEVAVAEPVESSNAIAEPVNPLDTIYVEPIEGASHFLLNFGGGMNTLLYAPGDAKWLPGAGAQFQLMYQYMFNENWGLGFGVGFSSMRARAILDDMSYSEAATNDNAMPNYKNYTAIVSRKGVKEIQDMISIDVPVQFFYRKPVNDFWAFNMGLGVTVNFPMWSQWQVKNGQYELDGIYGENIPVIAGSLNPDYGHRLYDYDANGEKGAFEHMEKVNVGVQLDLGATYRIARMTDFYFGVYGAYQFFGSVAKSEVAAFNANAKMGEDPHYIGILNSNMVTKAEKGSIMEHACVHPLEVGLKLGFRFACRDHKAEMAAKMAKFAENQEADRIAREKADAERIAREKAEAERLAREKAEAERLAREAAEAERLAREAAERERLAREEADRLAREKAEAEAQAKQISIVLQGVHFEHSSIEPIFNKDADEALTNLRTYLEQHPEKQLVLTGHTDNTGSAASNMVWGQKRAEAYQNALLKLGFNPDQIITESKGQTEPIATNSTEAGRAKNRRVEMKMVNK